MDIEKIQISHDVSEKKRHNQKWEHGLWLCSFLFLFFFSHKVAGCLLRVFRCAMGASGAKMDQNLKNLDFAILFRKIGSILKSRFGRDLSCRLSALSVDIGRKGCDIECFFSPKSSDIC